jgi:DNA-binding protein YbaB
MFKGLGNLGNIASMMGALQQLPEKMQALNEQMKSERVTASSPCGNVHISMNGVGHVEEVKIEGDLTGSDLEDAIRDATNAAGAAAKQLYAEAMSQMARDMDLNLPGIDNLLTNLTGGS